MSLFLFAVSVHASFFPVLKQTFEIVSHTFPFPRISYSFSLQSTSEDEALMKRVGEQRKCVLPLPFWNSQASLARGSREGRLPYVSVITLHFCQDTCRNSRGYIYTQRHFVNISLPSLFGVGFPRSFWLETYKFLAQSLNSERRLIFSAIPPLSFQLLRITTPDLFPAWPVP